MCVTIEIGMIAMFYVPTIAILVLCVLGSDMSRIACQEWHGKSDIWHYESAMSGGIC